MNTFTWVIFIYAVVLVVVVFSPFRETVWFVDAIKVWIFLIGCWMVKALSAH